MASIVALLSRLNAHVTMNPRALVPFASKLLSAAYANRGAPPSAVLARFESTFSASSGACRRICASAARFTSGSMSPRGAFWRQKTHATRRQSAVDDAACHVRRARPPAHDQQRTTRVTHGIVRPCLRARCVARARRSSPSESNRRRLG